MREYLQFYIGGEWVDPAKPNTLDVINPATEEVAGKISLGSDEDVDRAVKAARQAFRSFSRTTREERLDLLKAIVGEYEKRFNDLSEAITEEMGAPSWLAQNAQALMGMGHLQTAIAILENFQFDEMRGTTMIAKEPIGVCGFITPWNWPSNQIACKVAPAIATGCTMILKPSEIAPFSGSIWAEIMDAAGVPAGVFNLVHGDGPGVGVALSKHEGIDMVSFTGSTRAGVEVAKNAAPTVKRVHQELGGKSPNIILDDANMEKAIPSGVKQVMMNTGQSCNAPTRMLAPRARMDEVIKLAKETAESTTVGEPTGNAQMGPLVSEAQWKKVQDLIQKGIDEGAELVTGGPGKPEGLEKGYYVKPTIFANVSNDMTIAREEIFGPVLSILPYDSLEEAVGIGNDTEYGLSGYVQGTDMEKVRDVARQINAGQIVVNGAQLDLTAPFGGYKKSGNGREWGDYAFDEFLETKAIIGFGQEAAE